MERRREPLEWLVAKAGGVQAEDGKTTYRAASLANDCAILEINGKRVDVDFATVEGAQRFAEARRSHTKSESRS